MPPCPGICPRGPAAAVKSGLTKPSPGSRLQDGGKVASIKVRLSGGDSFEVSSLAGLVQLNAIRRFLAEGFQCHLASNPLLHQVPPQCFT